MYFKHVLFEDTFFDKCYFEDVTSTDTYFKNCTIESTTFYNTGKKRAHGEEYMKVDWGLEPKPIVRAETGVKGFVAISASFRGREMASTIH